MEIKDKTYYDKYDIMLIFGCGESKAMSIIRSVKYCTGDKLGIKGKILVTEFEAWKNAVSINF